MNTTSPPGSSKVDGARAAKCSSTLGRKAHDDEAGSEQWANQRRMSVLSGTENQSPQPEAELAGRMPGLPCPHLSVRVPARWTPEGYEHGGDGCVFYFKPGAFRALRRHAGRSQLLVCRMEAAPWRFPTA